MKRTLLTLLALVLLAAGSLLVYQQISPSVRKDPVTAGETFFRLLRDGLAYDAYRSTTASLQRLHFEAFERAALRHQLNEVTEIRWTRTALGETEANLTGDFFGADGQSRPLSLRMIREAGQWKAASLVSPETGSLFVASAPGSTTTSAPVTESTDRPETVERVMTAALPSKQELEQLARDTLLKFNEAVQIEYFAPFYQQISSAWQQQTTPAALLSAFQVFIDNNISFPGIARQTPEFSTDPSITPDGILILDGAFPNTPYRILFELKYVHEEGRWRAFGINLNLVASEDPPPATTPPPEAPAADPAPAPDAPTPAPTPSPPPEADEPQPTPQTPSFQIPAFRESGIPGPSSE